MIKSSKKININPYACCEQHLFFSISFGHKAQFVHWNIKGSDFFVIHEFSQKLYEDLQDFDDDLAEILRGNDYLINLSMKNLASQSHIKDYESSSKIDLSKLVHDFDTLIKDSEKIIAVLDDDVIIDHFTDRIGFYKKNRWMLKSFLK